MTLFNFIFVERKWASDRKTLTKHMELARKYPNEPYLLVMFPEGTTFSMERWKKSYAYAENNGLVREFCCLIAF